MYFYSSSSGDVWAVNRIQHICNTGAQKFPIYGLFLFSKRSQRDNIYNSKRLIALQKSILHLGISVLGCFLVCELWYYYNIMKNIILDRCLHDNGNHKEW